MLRFKNKADLSICVEAYNADQKAAAAPEAPALLIELSEGNMFEQEEKTVGGKTYPPCVGFFDKSVGINKSFRSFMNRPENQGFLINT